MSRAKYAKMLLGLKIEHRGSTGHSGHALPLNMVVPPRSPSTRCRWTDEIVSNLDTVMAPGQLDRSPYKQAPQLEASAPTLESAFGSAARDLAFDPPGTVRAEPIGTGITTPAYQDA